MPSLKAIRKRISSVKSTQKITRAMKMVAGARLNRAQQRITELRPYAVKTQEVLQSIAAAPSAQPSDPESYLESPADMDAPAEVEVEVGEEKALLPKTKQNPLEMLQARPEKRVLLLVLTSDRGLCGAFNTNINKRAEREWKGRTGEGQEVKLMVVGRKGRDYMKRRSAPVAEYFPGVWDNLSLATAQMLGAKVLEPFFKSEVDAVFLVYNQFKNAVTQTVEVERLLPVPQAEKKKKPEGDGHGDGESATSAIEAYDFEPTKEALLARLLPMYIDISILRALYESQASELGARMTAMDAATKNAKEMIQTLTLVYNKARQAAITKELMEIIGGSEALKE